MIKRPKKEVVKLAMFLREKRCERIDNEEKRTSPFFIPAQKWRELTREEREPYIEVAQDVYEFLQKA